MERVVGHDVDDSVDVLVNNAGGVASAGMARESLTGRDRDVAGRLPPSVSGALARRLDLHSTDARQREIADALGDLAASKLEAIQEQGGQRQLLKPIGHGAGTKPLDHRSEKSSDSR